jgi:hypothetical protein
LPQLELDGPADVPTVETDSVTEETSEPRPEPLVAETEIVVEVPDGVARPASTNDEDAAPAAAASTAGVSIDPSSLDGTGSNDQHDRFPAIDSQANPDSSIHDEIDSLPDDPEFDESKPD